MMADWHLDPGFWLFAAAVVVCAAFAMLLALRLRREARSALLLAAVVLSALWALGAAADRMVGGSPELWRAVVALDLLRLLALMGFVFLLLRGDAASSAERPGPAVPLGASVVAAVVLWVGVPAPGVAPAGGESFHASFAAMVALSVLGVAMVEQLLRRTPAVQRWHVWPLCVGLGGLFSFDLVVFADALLFRSLDERLWVARALALALVIPLLGLAASRNREWTFDLSLSRSLVLGSTALAGASVFLLALSVLGYYVREFGGRWGATLAAAFVFAGLLGFTFVAASRTLRSKLRVLLSKNLFAHRYDYRAEWLKFTGLMAAAGGAQPLRERCLAALGELVETSSAALWLRVEGGFAQVARVEQPAVTEVDATADEIPAFLRETGWVIDVEEARRDPARYRALNLPAWLRSHPNAWLVVPLLNADELIGYALLGRPRVQLKLDWEVLDLLKTAGRQTAASLAQETATEALLEARKFEAFNRMSAFVVHDLKNLVAQLQLMLRNDERHHANPQFRRDMRATVENVVTRMNGLLQQLHASETPVERPRAVDLRSVLDRIAEERDPGRAIVQVHCNGEPAAIGHPERLERVIGHLVQNALDAVDAAATPPRITVGACQSGDAVVLEVADNGAGMSAEFVRDRLFKPFSSSKQNGMGIGTYESRQYIHSIGGRIEVDSRPQSGTTFRVTLRAAGPAAAAT